MLTRRWVAVSSPSTALAGVRLISTEDIWGRAARMAKHAKDAATNFSERRQQAQTMADDFNKARDDFDGAYWDHDKKKFDNRAFQDRVNSKRSILEEDPDHPRNRKVKIEQSKAFVESESLRDLPRRITYGVMLIVSAVTIVAHFVLTRDPETHNLSFLPTVPWTDDSEDGEVFLERRRKFAEEQRLKEEAERLKRERLFR
jgi:hypothetical protein